METTAGVRADIPPPWTIEGHEDPKAWYMAMHERGEYHLDKRSGVWMFTGWSAVREFLSQPSLWSTAARIDNLDPSLQVVRLLTTDPPLHRQLRGYFAQAYRPDRIAAIEKRTQDIAVELMRTCLEKGTFDVVNDYSKVLAIITICEMLGIPKEEDHRILGPIGQIQGYLGALVPASEDRSVLELLSPGTSIPKAMGLMGSFFSELVARKRQAPADDLISDLARVDPASMPGRLDVSALLFEQFGAGTNTTVHAFVSLVHELHSQPALHRRVRNDRTLVMPLIEETLRLHSPLQARQRVATRDTTIDSQHVPAGTSALGWIGAANVDPRVFANPLEFDIDRPRNDHIAFGRNEHFCLGSHLARMEIRVALNVWLDTIAEFEPLTGREVNWAPDFILHGADSFSVRVDRAA